MQLSHEVHGSQAPVDTAHTKELCAAVFLKNGQLGGYLGEAQNDGMQKLHDSLLEQGSLRSTKKRLALYPGVPTWGLGLARVCQPPMPTHSWATSTVCLPHFFDYIITTEPLNPVVFTCTNKKV